MAMPVHMDPAALLSAGRKGPPFYEGGGLSPAGARRG
jgi:hypothetical protein